MKITSKSMKPMNLGPQNAVLKIQNFYSLRFLAIAILLMRTVQSLTSLSWATPPTAAAFLPTHPRLTPCTAIVGPHHKSHPCLLTLEAATGGADDNLPSPMMNNTTTRILTSSLPQAFLPPPSSASNAFLQKDPFVMPDGPQLMVPPTKSLRETLKVSSMSAVTTPPLIVGHRGSLYQELENTRGSFMACQGICHAIELDVFELPLDKTLVVFHGSGGDQTPGGLHNYMVDPKTTSIMDLTFAETQQLQFNTDFAELAAPADKVRQGQIPTLEQVLLDMKAIGMFVKIELKGPGTAKPVVELVDRLEMAHQVSFASFHHEEIAMVRQLRPQIDTEDGNYVYKTGALFDEVPEDFVERAMAVGASEIHLRYDTCSSDRVAAIHAAGLGSMAWFRGPIGMLKDATNNYWDVGNEDESCLETLIQTGVQQICTNRPNVLYDWLQTKQEAAADVVSMDLEQQQQQQSLEFRSPKGIAARS